MADTSQLTQIALHLRHVRCTVRDMKKMSTPELDDLAQQIQELAEATETLAEAVRDHLRQPHGLAE